MGEEKGRRRGGGGRAESIVAIDANLVGTCSIVVNLNDISVIKVIIALR